MKREILCEQCDQRTRPQHPEDVANGYKRRRTQIRAKKPEVHQTIVRTKGEVTQVINHPSLVCDSCNVPIADGASAYAHTTWNSNREGEPYDWEKEYCQ